LISLWRDRGMNIIWSGCATDFISRGYEGLCSFIKTLD